jgi:hypothetical protein
MPQLLAQRFAELSAQAKTLAATRSISRDVGGGTIEGVDSHQFLGWCVKVKNLLSNACGPDSEHYRAFVHAERLPSWAGNWLNFQQSNAVFEAAMEDFEGGYLASIQNLVRAEVLGTELEQAQELLEAGYESAAAVVAGVVLETTMRQMCAARSIPVGKLDRMNADLAKSGLYNALVQKQITFIAAIRNAAAHGDKGSFGREDVRTMVNEVERLVRSWLT